MALNALAGKIAVAIMRAREDVERARAAAQVQIPLFPVFLTFSSDTVLVLLFVKRSDVFPLC
jgi:hypothetical protein